MPVHNGERFLAEAVESILTQTFEDFEFILVDDGSTDASLQILQQYAKRDRRIRLISRENRGLIATLNEMLEIANGEFLARMDADDISTPTRFARQVEFLQANPEVVCVGGSFEIIDPKGRTVSLATMPESNEEIQRRLLSGSTIINHPCAMIRRTAMLKIGGYDATMVTVEDLDMLLRLGEIGMLANLKDVVLKYRFHMESVSAKNILRQREMAQEACKRAWQRRGVDGCFDVPKVWYRPTPDSSSQLSFLHKYGWWAFCHGFRGTAASCGLQAIAIKPSVVESWKLLACALIKPSPKISYLIYE
jgi:glycosyltransferase involved in cell wall biosynthesis